MPTTLSTVEAIWILQASIGLVVNGWVFGWSVLRWRWARETGDPELTLLASGTLIRSLGKVVLQAGFLTIGALAGLTPDPIREEVQDAADVISVLLMVATWILAGVGLVDFAVQWLLLQRFGWRDRRTEEGETR
jgi:hypothetical protein